MIRINLLPADTVKRPGAGKSLKLPSGGVWPYFLGLLLIYVAAGYSGWYIYDMAETSKKLVQSTTVKKDKLEKEVARREEEFRKNHEAMQDIEAKYEVAKSLSPENRVFWSEKLNMLAYARMDLAVFVTKLQLNEEITEIETEESVARREEFRKRKDKKGGEKEPKPVKRPVINQTLFIYAIAYGNDSPQKLRQVNSFQEVLRNLEWTREGGEPSKFIDGMKPDFQYLPQKVARVGGVDVLRFGLACRAEPQSVKTAKPKVKKQPAAGGAAEKPATGGSAK